MRRKGGEHRQSSAFRYICSFIAMLICTATASAQYNPFTSIYEFDQRSGEKVTTDTLTIPNVLIEVHEEKISASPLVDVFPNLELPRDSIAFEFPDLGAYVDTAALLWYLTKEDGQNAILSLMIIALSPDTVLHYYIDYDHNAKYDDKANPLILTNDVAVKEIIINPKGGSKYTYKFSNPTYSGAKQSVFHSSRNEALSSQKPAKDKARLDSIWCASREKPAIIIGGGLIIGPGKAVMEFDPLLDESVKHLKYTADIFSSGGIDTKIGITYKGFKVGSRLFAELIMYSGYREYFTYIHPVSGQLETNWFSKGNWPSTRFAYGVFFEYESRLSQDIRLGFTGSYMKYKILDNSYFIRDIDLGIRDSFQDTYLYSCGLKILFLTGRNHMLYISGYYQASYFNSRPYFDSGSYFNDIDPESYTMYYRQYCLSMGFDYRLGKK